MTRRRWYLAMVAGLVLLGCQGVAFGRGNAFSGPSSKVGPALGTARPAPARRAPRPAPVVDTSAPRIPLRNAAPYRPTISPYLNLFRPEASRVFNYYTLVKPQLAQLQFNAQQSQRLQSLQQQVPTPAANEGERLFMNHGKYFGRGR